MKTLRFIPLALLLGFVGFVAWRLMNPADTAIRSQLEGKPVPAFVLPPAMPELPIDSDEITITVIGKPNVGKSSFLNRLLGEERFIVSPVAGTTRDAIDTTFTYRGRRFRLVHVLFHDHVVELSTFRREPDPAEQKNGAEDDRLITSDNSFGTPEQDAFRRDFTINALSYDISDFSVLDWTGGVEDLERRTIRVIGDPQLRFREDPVRMMRACELAGRLGFGIDATTQEAIHELRREIEKGSPARLTEELLELQSGRGGAEGACSQAFHHVMLALEDMARAELINRDLIRGAGA